MSGTRSKKSLEGENLKRKKVFVRMSDAEFIEITQNANKYSNGNISKWMRERSSKPMLDVSIKMQDEIDGGFHE